MKLLKKIAVGGLLSLVSISFLVFLNTKQTNSAQLLRPIKTATIELLASSENFESFRSKVSTEDFAQINKAGYTTMVTRKPGGDKIQDKYVSFSLSGEYRVEKEIHTTDKSIDYVISTLYDNQGNRIWEGKTGYYVFVSNNGRNLVSQSHEGYELAFYDISSSDPVAQYSGEWSSCAFSDNGSHFIGCTLKNLYLFRADGELLWNKEFERHGGHKAIISSEGSYILINDRLAPDFEGKDPVGKDKYSRTNDDNSVKLQPATEKAVNPRFIFDESYLSLFRNDGSIIKEMSVPLYATQVMTFSLDDGNYAAVAGGNKMIFIETLTGKVLWSYEAGEKGYWIEPVAVSDGGQLIAIGVAKATGEKPLNARFEILNLNGEKIGHLSSELRPPITFTKDTRYLVSQFSHHGSTQTIIFSVTFSQ